MGSQFSLFNVAPILEQVSLFDDPQLQRRSEKLNRKDNWIAQAIVMILRESFSLSLQEARDCVFQMIARKNDLKIGELIWYVPRSGERSPAPVIGTLSCWDSEQIAVVNTHKNRKMSRIPVRNIVGPVITEPRR